MGILLSNPNKMAKLTKLQESITVTGAINRGVYMCDCTGCSNSCFESCADGNGPTN